MTDFFSRPKLHIADLLHSNVVESGHMRSASMIPASETETIHTMFHKLTQALTVLSSAAELTNATARTPAQNIKIWIQPSARQAEEILHRLREQHLRQSSTLTELTQSLTVLVLAADMIVQGQLSSDIELDSFALIRRNAERAMHCIRELRSAYE